MDVYATVDALRDLVAAGSSSSLDERLAAAVWMGSRYVDRRIGRPVDDTFVTPPYAASLTEVACPPEWRSAALAAATYYYKLPEAPMGYLGGLADYAVRIPAGGITTADQFLVGHLPPLVA